MKLVNLIPLKEIDFKNQDQFDAYSKEHELRPATKVTIAGKVTTAGQAAKKSEPTKGSAVFGKDSGGSVFGKAGGEKSKETPIKHTKVGPDSPEVQTIAKFAGVREKFLADFINQHKLDAAAVANFVEKGSKEDRKDFFTAAVGNPGNKYEKKIIDKFGEKGEPTEEPTSKPKEARKGNPTVNKEAKKKAEEFGITPQKLGKDGYTKAMYQAAVEALTDANFHDEARELISKIEGKPEWAKRVDYPKMDDPKYKEKMADLRKNGVDSSEYWGGEDGTHEFARKVSSASGWDGADAADGIAFTLRMNGFHKQADMIQSVFDDKPYMKENNMKLVNLVPLKEIDFTNQDQFDDYNKQHKLRPDTKVTVAGKVTTAGQAAQKSEPVKGSSVFGKDSGGSVFGKDKGDTGLGWGDETDRSVPSQLPKKASELNYKHSNIVADIVNKEAGLDGYAQTDDNSGAIMYNGSNGDMPTYTLYFGGNDDYNKPDEFRVSLEPTYGNDPSKLQGKVDKSFKSAEDANTFMIAVAKKYKKELQMDDDTNESTKLTSILSKNIR